MSCQAYEGLIGDYVDGTMDEALRAELESHLTTCASCRALADDFTAIRTASLSLEPHVPPPHVWRKLSAAIDAEPRPLFAAGPNHQAACLLLDPGSEVGSEVLSSTA